MKIDHLDAAPARHQSKFLAGEYQLRAGIADDGCDLRGGIVRVEWNGDGAALQDAEIGGAPMRVVGGENGATITARIPCSASHDDQTPPCHAAGGIARRHRRQTVGRRNRTNLDGRPVTEPRDISAKTVHKFCWGNPAILARLRAGLAEALA